MDKLLLTLSYSPIILPNRHIPNVFWITRSIYRCIFLYMTANLNLVNNSPHWAPIKFTSLRTTIWLSSKATHSYAFKL